MKYSNKQILKIEETAKKNKKDLTHITDKSKLSTEDIFKIGLCKHFVQHAVTKKLKLKDLADLVGVPVTRMSEITNYKIEKFSVDQLLKNLSALAKHDTQVKENLIFLGKAVGMPILPVTITKKLTKDLTEAASLR
ncbi:MAG: hypothetical protein H7235_07800 [Bdellovibrionaceae bacterium]|nr:hypothetical protein [Pseudobdellovibrionaceae bacterium]